MLERNLLIHLYNQGNNRAPIFYSRENYLYFLKKVRKYLSPVCEIIAYCLMPNHFHFLIYTTEASLPEKQIGNSTMNIFSNNLRIMLNSYSRAINKQQGNTGSIFRQNSKMKNLSEIAGSEIARPGSLGYDFYCSFYIHQNPVNAGLVGRIEDWEFSSYTDYIGLRNGTLVNKKLGLEILNLKPEDVARLSGCFIDESIERNLEV